MTLSAVVAPPVASPASRPAPAPAPAPTGEAREDAGVSQPFDRQLHAARQHNDADQPDRSASSKAADSPPAVNEPAAGAVASAPVARSPAEKDVGEKAPADAPEVDDQAASALAAAMLALLGPSVATVLRPAASMARAAAALVQADKTVAGDAKNASLLQIDAAQGDPAPATATLVAAGMSGLTDTQLLPTNAAYRDTAREPVPTIALAAPGSATAPSAPHQLQLQAPLGSQSFSQELGQQVAWLGGQNIKQARIRLHPEELGSLDVSVSVNHGRVDVVFSAQHPAAVAALQQSLPQLDQMLAQHGLSLGHSEVGQHDRGDRQGHSRDSDRIGAEEPGDIHGTGLPIALGRVSLLDAFA